MLVNCSICHEVFEVPDELVGDQTLDKSSIICGSCDPDEDPGPDLTILEDDEGIYYLDDSEPETCPHCGKEYEDFSDLGCEYCDRRHPHYGVLP